MLFCSPAPLLSGNRRALHTPAPSSLNRPQTPTHRQAADEPAALNSNCIRCTKENRDVAKKSP